MWFCRNLLFHHFDCAVNSHVQPPSLYKLCKIYIHQHFWSSSMPEVFRFWWPTNTKHTFHSSPSWTSVLSIRLQLTAGWWTASEVVLQISNKRMALMGAPPVPFVGNPNSHKMHLQGIMVYKLHRSVPLSWAAPKVHGFYPGLRSILHLIFMEIRWVDFV